MESTQTLNQQRWLWWESRRLKYNIGLVISGIGSLSVCRLQFR